MYSGIVGSSFNFKMMFVLATSWCALAPCDARASAIAGNDDINSAVGCDKRVSFEQISISSWCTQEIAISVSTGCYAAISISQVVGKKCTWQGCGILSLVGKAPTTDGTNFIEYGMKTPRNGAGSVSLASPTGAVLPQWPYVRHYLTAGNALKAKRACPANPLNLPGDVLNVICSKADPALLNLNPYWWCMNSKL